MSNLIDHAKIVDDKRACLCATILQGREAVRLKQVEEDNKIVLNISECILSILQDKHLDDMIHSVDVYIKKSELPEFDSRLGPKIASRISKNPINANWVDSKHWCEQSSIFKISIRPPDFDSYLFGGGLRN